MHLLMMFVVFAVMTTFAVGLFGAAMGLFTGLVLATVAWPLDFLVTHVRASRVDPERAHERKALLESYKKRGWWNWWIVTGCFTAVAWAVYGGYVVFTSEEDLAVEARYYLSFGATKPGPRQREQVPIVDVKTEVRRYILVAKNPPKHFYVTLKDVETNQVYEGMYVSKHCNNHADSPIGQQYNLQVTTRRQGDRTWLVFNNLYSAFCG